MMKKIITVFLNIILSFFIFMPTLVKANAEGSKGAISLNFALTVDDFQSVVLAEEGEIITVSFKMQRTDSNEAYTTSGFQNYIHYDLSFFEFVEGSIVCNDTGSATAKKQSSLTYGEIIQCQNMGKTYQSDFVFCTFQLKVIAAVGSGMIYNDEVYAYDAELQEIEVVKQNLQVKISDCKHTNKIKVAAKNPTCEERGWSAYCYCNACGVFFDENGENIIANVPFINGEHSFSNDISYDENGHWYECTKCHDHVNASEHSGGKATCKSKAKCEVCGQEYGERNTNQHTGKTYIKNEKQTLPWESGYTGDVYCSECQQIIKTGEVVSNWNFTEWPWWIMVVGLGGLLAAAIVLFLFSKV